jgi:hypothetical protein
MDKKALAFTFLDRFINLLTIFFYQVLRNLSRLSQTRA